MKERAFVHAVGASMLYWVFGHLCLLPSALFPDLVAPFTLGWIAVGTVVLTLPLLTVLFYRWRGPAGTWKDSGLLAGTLVGIHLPADYLFLEGYLPHLLPAWIKMAPIIYALFLLLPPIVARWPLRQSSQPSSDPTPKE